ncbi:MAG TPA: hypothetical protein VGO55_14215 [Allosphingosinicella sp.]|jgi:hypothetical protein|nr:hypothetical protein [Allosphingosinicella sp.]
MTEGAETRGDGFGGERKRLFLAALRNGESVLGACRLVGNRRSKFRRNSVQ